MNATLYPSDLSDEQWALVQPRSLRGRTGIARSAASRVNAILYQGRTSCQQAWAHLPHDLPQKSATYNYLAVWRENGADQVIHELLRCQVREGARQLVLKTLGMRG
ncbi:transposase [Streptomyces sp. NPDC006704]|uniref:transposase n=1 Tax=Streptomyces sp. NPDC006704 TaxID=3364760 RepID=UPI00367B614D